MTLTHHKRHFPFIVGFGHFLKQKLIKLPNKKLLILKYMSLNMKLEKKIHPLINDAEFLGVF